MTVVTKGFRALDRGLDRLMDRVTVRATTSVAEEIYKKAKRRRYGFTDRTGRLRKSLRIQKGRRNTAKVIAGGGGIRYASFVENKPRTRDRRPGPPYWLGRAREFVTNRLFRGKLNRDIQQEIRRLGL